MQRFSWLAIVVTMLQPEWWVLTWAPHPEQQWIVISYTCPNFYAVNVFDIEPGLREARVHRIDREIRPGACRVYFSVVKGESPERGEALDFVSMQD